MLLGSCVDVVSRKSPGLSAEDSGPILLVTEVGQGVRMRS